MLGAELGVCGGSMGRWELIKNWPEVSFAPYVGQKLCLAVCLWVYVYLSICVLGG